jgi:hypothetical protein
MGTERNAGMSDHSTEEPDATEQELCVQCLQPNTPGAHFCQKCGAPLTAYAATGPFESLFAEGTACRRAAEQPQRLIVVVGVWLIFGIGTLTGASMVAVSGDGSSMSNTVTGGALAAISLFIIGKTTWNYRRRHLGRTSTTTDLVW